MSSARRGAALQPRTSDSGQGELKMIFQTLVVLGICQSSQGQQFSGNSISSFVGQLTNLINQNGGLGALGSLVQQQHPSDSGLSGGNGGFGLYQRPGGRPPGYPTESYDYPHRPPYPEPSYPFYPPHPSSQPSLIHALASISRHDDLKCVPRLLCEVTSGGKPGYIGNEPSIVPLTNKENLIAFLTVMNFVDDSPLLTFGRAALIGYTARGNSRACLNAYPTCPRDPDALVDYLNNHKGGFFRFFGGSPQPFYAPSAQAGLYRPGGYQTYDYAENFRNFEHYAVEGRIQNRPSSVSHEIHRGKVVFPEEHRTRGDRQLSFPNYSSYDPSNFFPDRTGTGNLLLDQNRIHYASPDTYINFRDQRSVHFPQRMTFPHE